MSLLVKQLFCHKWLLVILLIVASIVSWLIYLDQKSNDSNDRIKIGSRYYSLEVADTPSSRQRGLSGRPEMSPNEALLFDFKQPNNWGIWMNDMEFAIDVVWLDGRGVVIDLDLNLTPDSYPKIYRAKSPSVYVIELLAGQVTASGLQIGERLELP